MKYRISEVAEGVELNTKPACVLCRRKNDFTDKRRQNEFSFDIFFARPFVSLSAIISSRGGVAVEGGGEWLANIESHAHARVYSIARVKHGKRVTTPKPGKEGWLICSHATKRYFPNRISSRAAIKNW